VSHKNELVRFTVPPARSNDDRFFTSLQIEFEDKLGRQAPEYVNIRHQVTTSSSGKQSITDLNALSEAKFTKLISQGGYEAAHFIDDTCDGYVAAKVTGLSKKLPDKPAYSLIFSPSPTRSKLRTGRSRVIYVCRTTSIKVRRSHSRAGGLQPTRMCNAAIQILQLLIERTKP
jgi:hypothetical protein